MQAKQTTLVQFVNSGGKRRDEKGKRRGSKVVFSTTVWARRETRGEKVYQPFF